MLPTSRVKIFKISDPHSKINFELPINLGHSHRLQNGISTTQPTHITLPQLMSSRFALSRSDPTTAFLRPWILRSSRGSPGTSLVKSDCLPPCGLVPLCPQGKLPSPTGCPPGLVSPIPPGWSKLSSESNSRWCSCPNDDDEERRNGERPEGDSLPAARLGSPPRP